MNRCLFCSVNNSNNNHLCLDLPESFDLENIEIDDFLWDTLHLYKQDNNLGQRKLKLLFTILTPSYLLSVIFFLELYSNISNEHKNFLILELNNFYQYLNSIEKYNDYNSDKFIKIFKLNKFPRVIQ